MNGTALDAAMAQRRLWPGRAPWIREAVGDVPRHAFAPERLWRWDGHAYVPVDREAEAGRWAAQVYAGPDDPTVTQVIDGRATSSLSCVAVVVDMLDSLKLKPGQRVLELGTGSGWNAALLARRSGPGLVTGVETDPGLAAQARTRLAAIGLYVTVEVGDGAAGWPAGGPYDRVICTYAVDAVPWAWVEQTRPGGRIVTPWGRLGHVALTVAKDGASATGWVQGLATFMPSRGTSPPPTWQQARGAGPSPEAERFAVRDLGPLRADPHLLFALRVALPDVHLTLDTCGGEGDGDPAVRLHDTGRTSWATLRPSPGGNGTAVVHQSGPRRLADEVLAAWDEWAAEGSPELYDFGMTVTRHDQYVWVRHPATGRRSAPRRGAPLGPTPSRRTSDR
ncbi:methyltransferase domain-containing protein [Streptomyces sp. NPDC050617]|uniref:methyltransferase domain-containing protein n=1 Tax=Streptomyces sp. NPDC050617 TaxID=3154628 RepID=UPI00343BF074